MHFLREWLRQPFDYQWTLNYHGARGTLGVNRISVGLWSCIFGLAALLSLGSHAGPRGTLSAEIAVALAAVSSIVVGAAWIRGPWPTKRRAQLFVVYSDVGVAVVLFSFADPFVAMTGCGLFAVTAAHVSVFHSPRWLCAHLVFATSVTLALYVSDLAGDDPDVAIATSLLSVLLSVLLSAPIMIQSGLLNLGHDASDAFRDHLTQLRNRRGMELDFPQLRSDGPRTLLAVLMLDVDGFKTVNDQHGHRSGDSVLELVAARLTSTAGPFALVARVGGEEFAVAITGSAEQVSDLAERLRNVLHNPHDAYPITLSIGVACVARCTTQNARLRPTIPLLRTLVQSADTAMYRSKKGGGDAVTFAPGPLEIESPPENSGVER
jgi:diguanylate cyclase (GGDEF)-like protein